MPQEWRQVNVFSMSMRGPSCVSIAPRERQLRTVPGLTVMRNVAQELRVAALNLNAEIGSAGSQHPTTLLPPPPSESSPAHLGRHVGGRGRWFITTAADRPPLQSHRPCPAGWATPIPIIREPSSVAHHQGAIISGPSSESHHQWPITREPSSMAHHQGAIINGPSSGSHHQ